MCQNKLSIDRKELTSRLRLPDFLLCLFLSTQRRNNRSEVIYEAIPEQQDVPPTPPRRDTSLQQSPPQRPLPSIPTTTSMDELTLGIGEDSDSELDSSDQSDDATEDEET